MNKYAHPAQWECDWIDANPQHYKNKKHADMVKMNIILRQSLSRASKLKAIEDSSLEEPAVFSFMRIRNLHIKGNKESVLSFAVGFGWLTDRHRMHPVSNSHYTGIRSLFKENPSLADDTLTQAVIELMEKEVEDHKPVYELWYHPRTGINWIFALFKIGDLDVQYHVAFLPEPKEQVKIAPTMSIPFVS